MNNLANSAIQKMGTYVPPLAGRWDFEGILLDFNERTIPVCPAVRDALLTYVNDSRFHLYPFYSDFSKRIANYAGVSENQVLASNGADQGIELCFRTYTKPGDKVIIPGPSFAMFAQCAGVQGNEILSPEYDVNDMNYPLEKVLSLVDENVRLIVVCNPNNPSGTLLSLEGIECLLNAAPNALILVDEAYFEFSGLSAVPLIEKYSNLAITRTFSKAFGLCSLRIGYVLSQAQNIQELMKVRGPYDLNMAAYAGVCASLENVDDMRAYVEEVMTRAKPLVEVFFKEEGVPYYPSQANYILFRPWDKQAVFEALKANGFMTRPQSGVNATDCIRVSIGTREQMERFIAVYKKFCLPPQL